MTPGAGGFLKQVRSDDASGVNQDPDATLDLI